MYTVFHSSQVNKCVVMHMLRCKRESTLKIKPLFQQPTNLNLRHHKKKKKNPQIPNFSLLLSPLVQKASKQQKFTPPEFQPSWNALDVAFPRKTKKQAPWLISNENLAS